MFIQSFHLIMPRSCFLRLDRRIKSNSYNVSLFDPVAKPQGTVLCASTLPVNYASYGCMLIDSVQLNQFRELLGDAADAVIADYFSNAAGYVAEIEAGIAAIDHTQIREAAHPLKSSSAQLGFSAVAEIAKDIEYAAKDTAPIDQISNQFPALKTALSDTEAAV